MLGALNLMNRALEVLKVKGIEMTEDEVLGAKLAILMHDIGHGPFSHTSERTLVDIPHETCSRLFMERLNREFGGGLTTAIQIFDDTYPKHFLHQLVSSQRDMDRLDYLGRDSFFTGVSEGIVGTDRIINMLNVKDDRLVVDEKGIYSVEKFIISRRLMYWQVYLHKTVVVAEEILKLIIKRAKELLKNGTDIFAPPPLKFFLTNNITQNGLHTKFLGKTPLEYFADLDDSDIISAIKVWQCSDDFVLSTLSKRLIDRNLFKIEIFPGDIPDDKVLEIRKKVISKKLCNEEFLDYFVIERALYNKAS
jgi:HD superfamily phosphohydrolase